MKCVVWNCGERAVKGGYCARHAKLAGYPDRRRFTRKRIFSFGGKARRVR